MMPKPEGMPDDIWSLACKLATTRGTEGGLFTDNYVVPLAEALLAERRDGEAMVNQMRDAQQMASYPGIFKTLEPFDPSLYFPEMMVGDGIALSSISHPRAPFWARVWSWFFPPKLHTDALETTVLDLGNGDGLTYEGFPVSPPANRLEEEIRRRLNDGDDA